MGALASPRSCYSAEQLEAGLLALAAYHGNSRQASRVLAEQGIEIPEGTLYTWKRIHAERYEEIHKEIVPQVRTKLAEQFEQVAMRSAEITLQGLDRYQAEIEQVPIKQLAGDLRNIGTTGAIGTDKASLLRGMPTEIRGHEAAEDVIKRLQQKHPQMFVDSTAEEMTDADVVEEKPRRGRGRELSPASSTTNAPEPEQPDTP